MTPAQQDTVARLEKTARCSWEELADGDLQVFVWAGREGPRELAEIVLVESNGSETRCVGFVESG